MWEEATEKCRTWQPLHHHAAQNFVVWWLPMLCALMPLHYYHRQCAQSLRSQHVLWGLSSSAWRVGRPWFPNSTSDSDLSDKKQFMLTVFSDSSFLSPFSDSHYRTTSVLNEDVCYPVLVFILSEVSVDSLNLLILCRHRWWNPQVHLIQLLLVNSLSMQKDEHFAIFTSEGSASRVTFHSFSNWFVDFETI